MRDLGVVLDTKLISSSHIIGRANRAMGTYLRSLQMSRAWTGRRFKSAPLIKAFNAHGSTIWSGAAVSHTSRLEKFQHKFWLAVNSNRPSDSLDYSHLLRHLDVLRIDQRLVQHDLTFLHGVFWDRLNSADILAMFSLAVPARRTRTRPVLNVPAAQVETVKNRLFCRLPSQVNCLCETVPDADLFCNRYQFKKCVSVFACWTV